MGELVAIHERSCLIADCMTFDGVGVNVMTFVCIFFTLNKYLILNLIESLISKLVIFLLIIIKMLIRKACRVSI